MAWMKIACQSNRSTGEIRDLLAEPLDGIGIIAKLLIDVMRKRVSGRIERLKNRPANVHAMIVEASCSLPSR